LGVQPAPRPRGKDAIDGRALLSALITLRRGDFSVRLPESDDGAAGRIATAFNDVVELNQRMARELSRVSQMVGKEGKISERASIGRVGGAWDEAVNSINALIADLVHPTRDTARVIGAVANGDLSQTMATEIEGRALAGEFLRTATTVNTMVHQLASFGAEVTRVAREVGTEGKLGGQANVPGVAGTWKDLTDNVNSMAGNLTSQVRNIAAVTTAVAKGDLSKKITVDVKGEILELKDTINTMVDQLNSFASEVTRVAREAGTEGKLGGQASVPGAAGTWKDLTDNVNSMAGNLTSQVRNIAAVTTAVAKGDLSKKITVDVKGEILELKDTINTLVDQLNSFAAEVTRVAREVGTEGKLGGQASVPGVAGTWKDLTDNVNSMASNLTSQVRNIAAVTTAVAKGDLSKKITVDVKGEILELKDTINTMVDRLNSFAAEVTRVAREVGTEGKLGGQASVPGAAGTWKDLTYNVNSMAGNLTSQVRGIAKVVTAVANGDLKRKLVVEAKGEIAALAETINNMIETLATFAAQVTTVAREVGTEGKLGGQANVPGVAGTWKDLTDNVNSMAGNLTSQVRNIAAVTTAVAKGDLSKKITVDVKGEILELKDTINTMVDQLNSFASEVTRVAREVGTEGELGGQASVPGAAGTWKDLTDNVNQLAANLTTQVRAIAEVATAVTTGDLTRSISVEARGEVAALKDNINEMIRNLKDTTLKNSEQDWLKTNLAKFSRMLQGQRDLLTVGRLILSELAPVVSAQHGLLYIMDSSGDEPLLKLLASYAIKDGHATQRLRLGESLVGQCAVDKQKILLTNLPPSYIPIASGLGEAKPLSVIVMPVVFEGQVKAVLELASSERFSPIHQAFLDPLGESIGIVLNTIESTMRTEDLLKQSQLLTNELQAQQEELQETNAQLQEKAKLLVDQNVEVERKSQEVEQARQALEDKAKQLALTSKYKSEFLANMSHELRTPLNNLLILSDQLSRNPEQNLLPKQVEFSKTIHASGNDLLTLINDILDLSKIESGTVVLDIGELRLADLREYVERTFRHVAESRRLKFAIGLDLDLPRSVSTDSKRLQQVLKNLLSNAFKFTERGSVELQIGLAQDGWNRNNENLSLARSVIAFRVRDTGIGIPPEKQAIIFEAFQQVDGSTSRKYGGTGLGLAISRELARLLGGELVLNSVPGEGSTFTLYVPLTYAAEHKALQPIAEPAEILRREQAATVLVEPAIHVAQPDLDDDMESIAPGDRVVLIVENDAAFARLLLGVAHETGMKGLIALRGSSALTLAREHRPDLITLDINLPDIDGWRVLGRLKDDLETRHIPVQVISTEEDRPRAMRAGAIDMLSKPIRTTELLEQTFRRLSQYLSRRVGRLLLAETDAGRRQRTVSLLQGDDTEIVEVHNGREAIERLVGEDFDAAVLSFELGGMKVTDLLDNLPDDARARQKLFLVYAVDGLSHEDQLLLKRLTETMPLKEVRSPDRLLDEVSLALHRGMRSLSPDQKSKLEALHQSPAILVGKKVLIVDDDVRNIFAMTSVLEPHGMQIVSAENGNDALQVLRTTDIDIVLMDIMMPDMDGYDTMRAIRSIPELRALPIIALTAKAMKGDREKCLDAGAWDYISKPVDIGQLLVVLRAWLHR
jgi:signal transduction histidine kinase/HAMP domain-containing protein/CheY-like chemotaxis protein